MRYLGNDPSCVDPSVLMATGLIPASHEDNTSKRVEMEKRMEPASKVTRKSKRIADGM